MFDQTAFRTWLHVVVGAAGFALAFLVLMLLTEELVGGGARLTGAVKAVTLAAFVGYVGTAWIVRMDDEEG